MFTIPMFSSRENEIAAWWTEGGDGEAAKEKCSLGERIRISGGIVGRMRGADAEFRLGMFALIVSELILKLFLCMIWLIKNWIWIFAFDVIFNAWCDLVVYLRRKVLVKCPIIHQSFFKEHISVAPRAKKNENREPRPRPRPRSKFFVFLHKIS